MAASETGEIWITESTISRLEDLTGSKECVEGYINSRESKEFQISNLPEK